MKRLLQKRTQKRIYVNFILFLLLTEICVAQITLVKDFIPGIASGLENQPEFKVYNGELYFFANDNIHGKELWKTNGTEEGTVLVKDIREGAASSFPTELTESGGILYFTADDGVLGRELWKTDGSELGTVMVKDINRSSVSHQIGNLFDYNGTLVFSVEDGVSGVELWKSGGTENSTILIKDIFEGPLSSTPSNFAIHNSFLYFTATGQYGSELYRTSGDELSTELVLDVFAGVNGGSQNSSSPGQVISLGNNPYFSAQLPIPNTNQIGRRLCTIDGNFLLNIVASEPFPELLTKSGDLIYYRSLSTESGVGRELYASNGTIDESVSNLVKDIHVGAANSNPSGFRDFNGNLMFLADDGIHGTELWRSNGTESGTVMVKDIFPGTVGSSPVNSGLGSVIQDLLFFSAQSPNIGYELWVSDSTENGTYLVMDLNPGGGSSNPAFFTEYNDAVYFTAFVSGIGRELFKLDFNNLSNPTFEKQSINHFYDKNSRSLQISKIENASQLQIYDLSGRAVFQTQLKPGNNVADINTLKNGIYVAKIFNNFMSKSFKFIVF